MALVTAQQCLVDFIDHMAKIKGFPLKVDQSIYSSDSTAFADAGIPSVTFCRFAPHGGAFIHTRKELDKYFNKEAKKKILQNQKNSFEIRREIITVPWFLNKRPLT